MADEKELKLEDTNMAAYSSPLADKVRKAAADTEDAWKGAGQKEGIEIWRIENFNVKRWPEDKYGEFFNGDSYIVLETFKPDEDSEDLDYNVFFWLGSKTTQDEYGTAAYKTVELDTYLGGEPVQFREVQGIESEEFLEVFPDMEIMDGGVASGFRKVEKEEFATKLFIVQGRNKKSVKISEVECAAKSVNDKDSFVLDAGLQVFSFNGASSSVWEKMKANAYVDKLQGKRPKCEAAVVDGFDDETGAAFWKILGGKPDALSKKAEPEEEKDPGTSVFAISDSKGGKVTMKEIDCKVDDNGCLSLDILDSSMVMMIDTGKVCFVWTGGKASKAERQYAMPVILENDDYARRPFRKCTEGKETKAFKQLFA